MSIIPTDSLRSVTYTRKHGLSASIMDDVPLNYLADAKSFADGVVLCQTSPGEYDFYAIEWLYKPFALLTGEDEYEILKSIVDEKVGNDVYRYGRKESLQYAFDPRSVSWDLGNDSLRSMGSGLINFAYVVRHLNDWIDVQDYDYTYREYVYDYIMGKLYKIIKPVYANIGGLYLNERYAGDGLSGIQPVPKELQKSSLKCIFDIMSDIDWLETPSFGSKDNLQEGK